MTISRLQSILKEKIQTEEIEEEETNALMPQGDMTSDKKKKVFKKKKEGKNTIRKVLLSGAAEYGAQLVEQVIRASHIDGNTLISNIATNSTGPFNGCSDTRFVSSSQFPSRAIQNRR